jgi:hypothetical protein
MAVNSQPYDPADRSAGKISLPIEQEEWWGGFRSGYRHVRDGENPQSRWEISQYPSATHPVALYPFRLRYTCDLFKMWHQT